jgi:fucose permease
MIGSQAVLAVTVSSAFLFGMVIVLLSCLRPQLAARLGVAEERVAGLWATMNFFLVPMMLLGGLLADAWDVRGVVLAGSLLTALALVVLLSATTMRVALLAFLIMAVGGAFLSAGALVLMPRAFFGPYESSASLNMGSVFFALGALVTPALTDVLLRAGGFRRTLGVLALTCLTPAVLIAFTRHFGLEPATSGEAQRPEVLSLLLEPRLWLAGLVFFLYAPLEGCLHTWGTTYLQNMGHTERRAARMIFGFWWCFLAGRVVAAFLQHWRFPPEGWPWVVVLALCVTVVLANLVGTVQRSSAAWGLLFVGFFLGPIFPTLIGLLFAHYGANPGTAFGVMFAIGSAGSLVLSPLIGARFNRRNAQTALRFPLALAMLLLIVSLFFGLTLS